MMRRPKAMRGRLIDQLLTSNDDPEVKRKACHAVFEFAARRHLRGLGYRPSLSQDERRLIDEHLGEVLGLKEGS